MKQKEFADVLGISVVRLKSYEYARAPIRFALAKTLTDKFSVNPKWLALGVGPMTPGVTIPSIFAAFIPSRALFSFIYDRLIGDMLEREASLVELPPESLTFPANSDWWETLQFVTQQFAERLLLRLRKMDNERILDVFHGIELLVGRFDKLFWDTLNLALTTRKNREPTYDIAEVKKQVLEKLGMSAAELRSLNVASSIIEKEEDRKFGQSTALTPNHARRILAGYESTRHPSMQKKRSYADRISSALISTGFTQAKAAEKWGINRRTLEDWIQKRRTPRGLYRDRLEKILSEIEQSSAPN